MICFRRYPPSQTTPAVKREYTTIGILLLVLIVFGLMLSGCEQPRASSQIPDSNYKVIDTGYWVRDLTDQPAWLDNERILFTSTEDLAFGQSPYRIQVFNIATGKVVSTPLHTFVCVRDGQVLYGVRDKETDKLTYYRGPLGKAVKHPNPDGSSSALRKDHSMVIDTVFNCDWVPKVKLPESVPYRRKLLGKNYLETIEKRMKRYDYQKRPVDWKREQQTGEDRGPEGKVLYHSDESDPGRLMPSGRVAYSEYLDAYVVGHDYYDPKYAETRSLWILQRNGELKEVPYPEDWLKGRSDIYPVKPGYLIHYTDGPTSATDPGDRGLYIVHAHKVQRLILGLVGGITVSSDGCKVAFRHADSVDADLSIKKPYRTLKYINFCQGGTTS